MSLLICKERDTAVAKNQYHKRWIISSFLPAQVKWIYSHLPPFSLCSNVYLAGLRLEGEDGQMFKKSPFTNPFIWARKMIQWKNLQRRSGDLHTNNVMPLNMDPERASQALLLLWHGGRLDWGFGWPGCDKSYFGTGKEPRTIWTYPNWGGYDGKAREQPNCLRSGAGRFH